jgi:uncharacterized protein
MPNTTDSPADLRFPEPGQTREYPVAGPAGRLQVALSMPREALRGLLLVAHPHPLFGGTMDNKVTHTLARAAAAVGYAALRFNFRGVGDSEGVHDEGRGETDDAVLLARRLSALAPTLPLAFAGFSFGGFVLLRAAVEVGEVDVLTVAPPLRKYVSLPPPPRPRGRWWVLHGTADEVVDYEETRDALAAYAPPPRLIPVSGVGHFFHGELSVVQRTVGDFLA